MVVFSRSDSARTPFGLLRQDSFRVSALGLGLEMKPQLGPLTQPDRPRPRPTPAFAKALEAMTK